MAVVAGASINLRREKCGSHERPHKPAPLLAILDLLDRGQVKVNEIVLTPWCAKRTISRASKTRFISSRGFSLVEAAHLIPFNVTRDDNQVISDQGSWLSYSARIKKQRLFLQRYRQLRLFPEVAYAAAEIDRELTARGLRLGENDNWIAGFCRHYGQPLISQDAASRLSPDTSQPAAPEVEG
jgi:hypothetical protein